jgi:hypothetical protein
MHYTVLRFLLLLWFFGMCVALSASAHAAGCHWYGSRCAGAAVPFASVTGGSTVAGSLPSIQQWHAVTNAGVYWSILWHAHNRSRAHTCQLHMFVAALDPAFNCTLHASQAQNPCSLFYAPATLVLRLKYSSPLQQSDLSPCWPPLALAGTVVNKGSVAFTDVAPNSAAVSGMGNGPAAIAWADEVGSMARSWRPVQPAGLSARAWEKDV